MQQLSFTNSRESNLVLGYSKPYFLQNLIGLSDTPTNNLSVVGYQQDGQTPMGQFLQARMVTFSLFVFGDNDQDRFTNRRNLIRYLNPKEEFTCIYTNDYMSVKFTCRIDGAPKFESTNSNKGYQACTISLLVDDPYLYDVNESQKQLSIVQPMFSFPLVFNPNIVFSTLTNKTIVITNNGDVATPVRIQMLGATENPSITNNTTGEFIKVNKTIEADEILEINTGYGQKRVEIISADGTRTNAFNYIDLDSTFFQLEVGDNEISYDADSGADSAMLYIFYSNRYVGV